MKHFDEKKHRGFTLIELLVAMVIALVVITSLASAFIYQRKTYDVQEQVTEMIQSARAAMDMIAREIEMAGYDPANAGLVGIPWNAAQLEVRADLNGDKDTNDTNEDIIYKYNSGTKQIERNAGSGDQIFSENIKSFSFKFYQKDGTTEVTSATNQGDIRQVEIAITARTSKPDPNYSSNNGYRTFTLTSRITPPNLDL